MFQVLLEPLGREALARLTLLMNHVIAAEPEATRRLASQTGGTIGLEWQRWPSLLPPAPRAAWHITPAGLLELDDDSTQTGTGAELLVGLDHQALLGWLLGGAASRPPMEIHGDAALAAEVSWLAENLRWDIEDDLARVVGNAPAHQMAQFGRAVSRGLQALLQRVRPAPNGSV